MYGGRQACREVDEISGDVGRQRGREGVKKQGIEEYTEQCRLQSGAKQGSEERRGDDEIYSSNECRRMSAQLRVELETREMVPGQG